MEKYSNSFVRNCFENGMLLTAADLTNLQNYFDGKRRIGYKGLIGYGIVFGLTAEASGDRLVVSRGLAIDRSGREIYVPSAASISVNSLYSGKPKSGKYYLYIEYAEEPCGEAFLIRESKLEETVRNRVLETFRLTADSSLECQKLCIAGITVDVQDGIAQISNIYCFPASFHLSAMWKRLLPHCKSGLISIGKDDLPDENGVFRTQEIHHGLGIEKNVAIELSVKSYAEWRECEIFGDHQLFDAPIQLAAKHFPATGTFVIAVKPQDPAQLPVRVRWRAQIAQEDDAYV